MARMRDKNGVTFEVTGEPWYLDKELAYFPKEKILIRVIDNLLDKVDASEPNGIHGDFGWIQEDNFYINITSYYMLTEKDVLIALKEIYNGAYIAGKKDIQQSIKKTLGL